MHRFPLSAGLLGWFGRLGAGSFGSRLVNDVRLSSSYEGLVEFLRFLLCASWARGYSFCLRQSRVFVQMGSPVMMCVCGGFLSPEDCRSMIVSGVCDCKILVS